MRIFKPIGEKLYQEWVLRFCTKESKSQGPVPFNLLANPVLIVRKFDSTQPLHKLVDVSFMLNLQDMPITEFSAIGMEVPERIYKLTL